MLTCCWSSQQAKSCWGQGVLSCCLRSPFLLQTDNYSKNGVVWILGRWIFSCQHRTMVTSPYDCRVVGGWGFCDYLRRDTRSLHTRSVQLFQIVRALWLENGTIPSVPLAFISTQVNTPNRNACICELRLLRCSISTHHLAPKHSSFLLQCFCSFF
jgi:hypothetical protein